VVSVSDSGAGIGSDTIQHIFEPFSTTKEVGKGTGLGLAIVYGIVKNIMVMFMFTAEPGKGTTFKIYIPLLLSWEMGIEDKRSRCLHQEQNHTPC
jgi:C4-dicarboxylate-specific signal transduction histidine kinase